jgi:hypothetical protein
MSSPLLTIKNYPNDMPENIQQWLLLLNTEVSRQRQLLNCDTLALAQVLHQATHLNALSIKIAQNLGGTGLNLKQQHYYYREMGRHSGAVAFLCAQHSTALDIIATGAEQKLKDQYLNKKYLFAVSFSHLREMINPPVLAINDGDGYIVNGNLRYITGYKLFNMLLIGFVCSDQEVFALIPFVPNDQFVVLKQLDLVAANSAQTVACLLINYRVDKDMVVSIDPHGTFNNKKNGTRNIASFHIGLALATLDLVNSHKFIEIEQVRTTYNYLINEIQSCEDELAGLAASAATIPIRIKIMALLNKVFLFADQIFKGSQTVSDHPYNLIKKEAQIFLSLGSTVDTLIATCERLT